MSPKNKSQNESTVPEFFSVYYMNKQKVYEMRMLLDNEVKRGSTKEQGKVNSGGAQAEAQIEGRLPFLSALKGNIKGDLRHESQQKIVDTLEYVNTTSGMLRDIMHRAQTGKIEDFKEGELVYIADVSLELLNENEVRSLIVIMNGTLNGVVIPEAGSLDVGRMLQSLLKDGACFKLKGKTTISKPKNGKTKDIATLMKIPLDGGDMFESGHTIDDLLIGKVGIVGICKGETSTEALRSSLDYFSDQKNDNDEFVDGSSSTSPKDDCNDEGMYIDVLAIVQAVNLSETGSEE